MELQTVLLNIFYGLFKLSILVIFVTAIIQVIKGTSVVGFFRMIWQILKTLWKTNGEKINPETWQILNFIIALIGLKLLNITLLANFLGLDLEKNISPAAAWFDYVGTASVCYMGTEWFYKRFGWAISQGAEFKKLINGAITTSKEEKKTETTTETKTVQP